MRARRAEASLSPSPPHADRSAARLRLTRSMDHHDDPDDPAEVVEPPFDRRVRGRHFDGRVPKFRAPAAMLEARSWALRDFLAVTGIGVMLDTEKEAAAVAVRPALLPPLSRCEGFAPTTHEPGRSRELLR